MDLVYIGVLIIALAFALVVTYASLVLKRAADTMTSLSQTLNEVEQKLHYITPELRETVEKTGYTVDDLQDKINAVDDWFGTLENLGISINEGSRFVNKQAKNASSYTTSKNRSRVTQSIKWADVVYKLYKKVT
ncbi:DUF948 domain containing protein [Lentibacillus kapialis]|uniref:DUF948 domain containing protein n=1 Tax=Lentibacillus kapialis TaxID=340214 RepID=A0A917UZ60_9BACI|nr:DUF948 domain-containing protein [Lentibacillus kapialis]GGJ98580.1 DUF948 domain containing protein [Lentibacillus kapialis]